MKVKPVGAFKILSFHLTFAGPPYISCVRDTFGFDCRLSARMS